MGGGSGGWRGARGGGALHQAATAGVRHGRRARGVAGYELDCLHHLRTNTTCKCTTTDSSPHMIPSSVQQAGGWISVHNTVLSGVDCTLILNPWFLKVGVGRVWPCSTAGSSHARNGSRRLDTGLKKYMYTMVEEMVGCEEKCTTFYTAIVKTLWRMNRKKTEEYKQGRLTEEK